MYGMSDRRALLVHQQGPTSTHHSQAHVGEHPSLMQGKHLQFHAGFPLAVVPPAADWASLHTAVPPGQSMGRGLVEQKAERPERSAGNIWERKQQRRLRGEQGNKLIHYDAATKQRFHIQEGQRSNEEADGPEAVPTSQSRPRVCTVPVSYSCEEENSPESTPLLLCSQAATCFSERFCSKRVQFLCFIHVQLSHCNGGAESLN